MNEPQIEVPVLGYEPWQEPARADRSAVIGLVVATVFWGVGFVWAKNAGQAVHRAVGLPDGSMLGPVYILAWRFLLSAVAVFAIFPGARRGWTWRGAAWSMLVGVSLAAGLLVQHWGLDRSSEAVTAFLTSLTILFVPLLSLIVFRKSPSPLLWAGVVVATLGIWLMTGGRPEGFGLGEALGLACALLFGVYILFVNAASKSETAWRLSAGQFLVTSIVCFATCLLAERGTYALSPRVTIDLFSKQDVWLNTVLMSLFPTLGAFVLLNVYQPRLDPTRAALIYLIEPVVATIYAWAIAGRKLGPEAIIGAGLILVANVLVEVLAARMKRKGVAAEERVVLID